jgi:hypothetical protein
MLFLSADYAVDSDEALLTTTPTAAVQVLLLLSVDFASSADKKGQPAIPNVRSV